MNSFIYLSDYSLLDVFDYQNPEYDYETIFFNCNYMFLNRWSNLPPCKSKELLELIKNEEYDKVDEWKLKCIDTNGKISKFGMELAWEFGNWYDEHFISFEDFYDFVIRRKFRDTDLSFSDWYDAYAIFKASEIDYLRRTGRITP